MRNTLLRIMSICLVMLMLIQGATAVEAEEEITPGFENKTISILGDSISTFEGVSSGEASQTTNTTIKGNRDYYKNGRFEVTLNDTWWMQAKEALGAEILVNNSYSNTTIFSPFSDDNETTGYLSRPYNLHDNTGENAGQEPDIVAVYMGTNDVSYHKTRLGSYAEIDFDSLILGNNDSFIYKKPTTSAEAYAIMLHKIINTYKNAEVYCFTLLPRHTESKSDINLQKSFNETIKEIANHYGCFTVDLYNDSGITAEEENYSRYLLDSYLHPNNMGMDTITGAFLSSLYENSRYAPQNTVVHNVSYQLEDVIVNEGTVKKAIENNAFKCTLTKLLYGNLNVTVKMNDEDITELCYSDGKITIPQVTGSIEITASVTQEARVFKCYRYENTNGNLNNISKNENYSNVASQNEEYGYTLENDIKLCYDTPWTAIFRVKENESESFNVLSSQYENGAALVFDKKNNIIGISFNSSSDDVYGIDISSIDSTAAHTYKIINEHFINGTNCFTLYIDNKLFGTFDSHFVNGEYADSNISPLYENDFIFNCISKDFSTDIEYIQIWESETKTLHKHSFGYPELTVPTCTEYGSTITTCDCGASHSEPNIPPKGHKEGAWLMSKPATAEEQGESYKECSVCKAVTQTKAIPEIKCDKPVISSLANTENGIKVSWKRVKGADSYRVYHRLINGTWKYLGTVATTSFVDTDVKNGYWYYYTVRAVNEAGFSDYNTTGNLIQALKTPKFKSAQNVHQGIKLSWNKINGAKGYYIYRKAGNGEWQYYCCTSATSYTDKKVSNGVIYSYRIRAFRNDTVSGYYSNGITLRRFASPVLKTPVNTDDGIKVQWNKLSGATGYYVYRKTSTSGWKYIGKTTNTYFTDTKAEAGQTYTYTVKAYNSVGQSSAYNTAGISYKRLTTPKIYDADSVSGGIKIKWKDVKGADGYYVYRKTANSTWKYLGKTTSKKYTDTTAKKGVTYTYTVKAYNSSYVSMYNTKGINAKR